VAWLAPVRRQEVRSMICLIKAPEICNEVLSSFNTPEEKRFYKAVADGLEKGLGLRREDAFINLVEVMTS
jgi:hypothetical protein